MEKSTNQPEDISYDNIVSGYRRMLHFVLSKWKSIFLITITGALLGACCSFFLKPKYSAVCTFVLDDNSSQGMLSQYAGLASLAGIDISGGGGIFKGDNIIELYKSRAMIEKALLSDADFNGKNQRLIERYISYNGLLEKWKTHDHIDHIRFDEDPNKFSRVQDSIVTDIAEKFNKKSLIVEKPDKKLSIIKVTFTDQDELFAKEFTEKLVENVNSFFIQTKTEKTAQNVQILQRQADSVKSALNVSIYGVASASDAAPNANPQLLALRVPSQKKQVDVQANTAIYAEIIKNLEIAKISLRQQMPLIQLIDKPVLPLDNNRIKLLPGCVVGAFIGLFFSVCFFIIQGVWKLIRGK